MNKTTARLLGDMKANANSTNDPVAIQRVRPKLVTRYMPIGPSAAETAKEIGELRAALLRGDRIIDELRERVDTLEAGERWKARAPRDDGTPSGDADQWFTSPRARVLSESDVWRNVGVPQFYAVEHDPHTGSARPVKWLVVNFRMRVSNVESLCVVRGEDNPGYDNQHLREERVVLLTKSGRYFMVPADPRWGGDGRQVVDQLKALFGHVPTVQ